MDSYGFADGNGHEITRGLQITEDQAYALCQRYADERGITVECWVEGASDPDEEPAPSLYTCEPSKASTLPLGRA